MITLEEFKKKHSDKCRLIGLDLGSKRIGVSICDEKQLIATPLKTIVRNSLNELISELKLIINENDIKGIIIGNPLNIFKGFPIMIPFISFSLMINLSSLISSLSEFLTIVFNGVAINCFSSQIDTPILLEPRSKPINLHLSECFFLNSSKVIILYILNLSDSLRHI